MKTKIFDILKPALILTIICVVLTAALAATNLFTKDIIAKGAYEKEQAALSHCIEADSFKKLDNLSKANTVVYEATKDQKIIGYAFSIKKNGYGGDVSVIVGVIDGKVSAIEITDVSNETPGLGQNAKNEKFTNQFKGIQNADEVVAMTGATITSNAVKSAVADALTLYNNIVKGAA